jgi:hypothetical protein
MIQSLMSNPMLLAGAVAIIVALYYALRLKVNELSQTRSAIRELASNYNEDVTQAQQFATDQDKIAKKARDDRADALKLAAEMQKAAVTASDLAQKKRAALKLFTTL